MKRTIQIEGMSCEHCQNRVQQALNNLPGVVATVSLPEKTATVMADASVGNDTLRAAVTDAGYEVVCIS